MKFWKYLFIPLLIFFIFSTFYIKYSKNIPVQYWDEGIWPSRTYYFDLLIKGDFKNPLWQHYFAYDQPKVPSYIFGAVLYPSYLRYKSLEGNKEKDFVHYLIDQNFYQVDCDGKFYCEKYHQSYINNKNFVNWKEGDSGSPDYLLSKYGNNFSKTIDLIFHLRNINAVILALSVVVAYFLVLTFSGWTLAFVTAVLYGFNSLIIDWGLMATSEAPFLFFFNLGLFILFLIFKSKKTDYRLLILFSVITALCAQTKLNGFMLLVIFYIFILYQIAVYFKKKKFSKLRTKLTPFLLVSFISGALFILIDPFLYSDPIKNVLKIIDHRQFMAETLSRIFPQNDLSDLPTRISVIYEDLLVNGRGAILNNVLFPMKTNFLISTINILLFIWGVVFLKRSHLLILVFFVLIQIIMLIYLKLNWERYFIQLVFFFIFFQILGLLSVFKAIKSRKWV